MRRDSKIRKLNNDVQFTNWFEEVYQTNFEQLFRYAFSITKNKQLAEDVVAEVFTNIWNKKPDYSSIRELSSYLHVSVKHLAIRMTSRDPQHFTYSTYDESLQISDTVDPENLLLGKELSELVSQIIDELPPHSRLVYDLAKNKGYSNQQIADELGISRRTVETHIHNVLKKLRESLKCRFEVSDKQQFLTGLAECAGLTLPSFLINLLVGL